MGLTVVIGIGSAAWIRDMVSGLFEAWN